MFYNTLLQFDDPADPVIFIQYKFSFGKSWEECGVSRVNGYLSALGFSDPQEVAKFCDAYNILEKFSTEDWARRYSNAGDREIIAKFGRAASQKSVLSLAFIPSAVEIRPLLKSSYSDFFQILFTWVTGGDSSLGRERFIKYWEAPSGGASWTVRDPYFVLTDTLSCRKSFKDAVTAFLAELRNPKPKADAESWLVNVNHAFRQKMYDSVLTRANWGYISGTAANASISAGKFLSLGGGSGGFAVFDTNVPQKVYPLMTASGNAGVGAGVALPVNVTVDPAELPSKGTIYHGFAGNVAGVHSFIGAYVAISGGVAATILNQTASLMFIAPVYSLPPLTSQNFGAIFTAVVPLSTAILALDGHGIEVGFGTSAQLSCGFVSPRK